MRALLLLVGLLATAMPALARAAPTETIREEHRLTINGQGETRRLLWVGPTAPACSVNDLDSAATCLCAGFPHGEAGHLVVVRLRGGREVERLDLDGFFDNETGFLTHGLPGPALLRRYRFDSGDLEPALALKPSQPDPALAARISRRPVVSAIAFADYSHDGAADAFLLQVSAGPCGHQGFVAIGVSPDNPRLQALASVETPDLPLVLPEQAWQALARHASPVQVADVSCGDHASETDREISLKAAGGRISAQAITYSCTGLTAEKAAKPISEEPY